MPGRRRRRSRGQGGRRGGDPGQERVPGQHEPRDPHADERHHRHDRAGARHRARPPSSASTSSMVQGLGRRAADGHQRHPRLLQDRGRQARPGADRLRPARQPRRHRASRWRCARTRRGWSWPADVAADVPGRAGRRPGPAAPGRSSTWSATPSSSPSGARSSSRVEPESRTERRGRACTSPSRDTGIGIPRREAAADLRGLRPGRRLDDRQVRRHRAGPGDLGAAGRADGRPDLGRERGRAGAAPSTSPSASAVPDGRAPRRRAEPADAARPAGAGRGRQRHQPPHPRGDADQLGHEARRPSTAAAAALAAHASGPRPRASRSRWCCSTP